MTTCQDCACKLRRAEKRQLFLPTLVAFLCWMIVKLTPFTLLSPFSPSHSSWLTFWAFGREKVCLSPVEVKAPERVLFTSFFDIKRPNSTQPLTLAICLQRQREKNNAGRQSIVAQEDSCATVWRCKYCGLHIAVSKLSIDQAVKGEFQSGYFLQPDSGSLAPSESHAMKQSDNLKALISPK